ncbi:MAG: hypothetical protein L6455_13165 [Kiritimatiellae bacterium]|nr:hypothetical protein [Kiritimatiellia bacterium]
MKPLLINNSLFWQYEGKVACSWYLCGDGVNDAMRDAHMTWCVTHNCDGIILCLNNEELMTLFADEYMRTLDMRKYTTFITYCDRLKAAGAKIVFAFYDGPPIPNAKYPCLGYMDRHEAFIKAACQTLNQYASAYLIGCETNRYWDVTTVRKAIAVTKQHAGLIPVGSHEQWNPQNREFVGGDFCCYETRNHPKDGDSISVGDMVAEVQFIQRSLPPGFPVWVAEFNLNDSARAREQARALADLPGVVGVGGPM